MAEPSKAQLIGTVSWSNGEPFTGFVLLGLALPTFGGTSYTKVSLQNWYPPQRIPLWYRIPIVNGSFDSSARIYYNADLEPPNTKYAAWFYDVHNVQIGGPSALFTVSTPTHSLTIPTLTVPTATTEIPTPDTQPTDPEDGVSYVLFVDNEIPFGTIDGSNVDFYLAAAPDPITSLQVFKNGQLLYKDVGYTLSGTHITFIGSAIPRVGDVLRANYRIFSIYPSPASPGAPTGFITNEIPSGAINGANLAYVLAFEPNPQDSLMLYKNGQLLAPSTAYTLSGTNITIVAEYVLLTGDLLRASYRF